MLIERFAFSHNAGVATSFELKKAVGGLQSAVCSEKSFDQKRGFLVSNDWGAEMPARNYRDLIAWKKAFELAVAIYEETAHFPLEEKFGITAQLRRACVSIPSNIAEGEGRKSPSIFRYCLSIALGSLKEAETQILLSEALGYIGPDRTTTLMAKAAEVGRLINGLSNSITTH